MVAFSSTLARPRYRSRASAGSVPFVRATLQLASLGTTSVSANVSLQRSLAGRIPNIAFSNIAAPPSTQRARVSDRLNIGNANPQSFGSPSNLEAFGKDIGERISNPFEQSRKVGIGEFENPNLSITAPKPTVSTAQSITLPAALGI